MLIQLVHNEPLVEPCECCQGTCVVGDDYCAGCGGDGIFVADFSEAACFFHNIAIVGGLQRALELGKLSDVIWHRNRDRRALDLAELPIWSPGCGRDAPADPVAQG